MLSNQMILSEDVSRLSLSKGKGGELIVKDTKANNAISPQVVRDYMEYMETNKSISSKMVRDCMKYMKSNKFISPQVVRD